MKELPEDYSNYGEATQWIAWPDVASKCNIQHSKRREWLNKEKTVERVSCDKCKYYYTIGETLTTK